MMLCQTLSESVPHSFYFAEWSLHILPAATCLSILVPQLPLIQEIDQGQFSLSENGLGDHLP